MTRARLDKMTTKRSSSVPKYMDTPSEKPLKTTEEFDCERRGYKLTKTCLGTGAYAKVKLAYVLTPKLEKDKRLADELKEKGTNKVAIKIISRKSTPKEYINKFMPREIETLHATYRFPHVIQLYETFRTESRVYLVMEYSSKGDLLEFINKRSGKTPGIGETKAKIFFKQLVAGVQHCHRRNVTHRDLKCENILIDDDEEIIKISDFGFATRFPTNKQKMLETFCGSYAYAAPEILQAEKYDGKIADIWSIGIILFAMINGRLPYNDRNIRTLIEQTKAKPRFSSRVQVTVACQDLICKILTPEAQRRATLMDIIRHPWMSSEDPTLKSPRGIPDGKSNEVVANEPTDDVPKYNLTNNKKIVYQPYTKRVLQRERWMDKVPEPQAIQKLLHTRRTKDPIEEGCLEKVAESNNTDTNAEMILSQYWEERKKSGKPRKPLITGLLSNKYRPEPVVTKIACGVASPKAKEEGIETGYRLSPHHKTAIKASIVPNSGIGKDRFLPASKSVKKDICLLPPVCATGNSRNTGKTKSNSAPAQCQQRSPDGIRQIAKKGKIRQASTQSVKQFKTKAIQNFSFNQPGVNIEVVNLQRNWQKLKQTASLPKGDGKTKRSNNIELTYYTLSGKEMNVKNGERSMLVKKGDRAVYVKNMKDGGRAVHFKNMKDGDQAVHIKNHYKRALKKCY